MSKPRPSIFPAWSACPCFDSNEEVGEAAERGTLQHKHLERWLKNDHDGNMTDLEPVEAEGVIWARDYIREWCKDLGAPILSETKLALYENPDDFESKLIYEGTGDAICSSNLFDYKSGNYHNYEPQMFGYALCMFQRDPSLQFVMCHILYGKTRVASKFHIRKDAAEASIRHILAQRADPQRKPQACEYCVWCSHKAICGELNGMALTVASGREDWKLENYHASQIIKADEMAKALRLARFLASWCESVEHHAKVMAIKNGEVIPGFSVSSRAGNRFVKDLPMALGLSGLTPDEFLKCCTAKIGELEKKLGKKKCAELLEPVIGRASEQYFLTEEKQLPAPVESGDTDF